MDKNAIKKMYEEKEKYVEETLAAMLGPMSNFGTINYAKDPVTDEEFVKFVRADGYPFYINMTGNSLSAIGAEICGLVAGKTPAGIITVREKQIDINKRLFAR